MIAAYMIVTELLSVTGQLVVSNSVQEGAIVSKQLPYRQQAMYSSRFTALHGGKSY